MSLKNKIPPPIVALIFVSLIYLTSDIFFTFSFQYQKLISLIIFLLGVLVSALALVEFIKLKTTINPMKPNQASSLVTRGIYRVSRNPMYLGILILLISFTFYLGAFVSGGIFLPLFVVYMNYFQIIPEEKAMEELFKNDFKGYTKKTRRWI